MESFNIAIVVPCYNEEKSIAEVIHQFKKELPTARLIVCDNASTDQTAQVARSAGAEVLSEPRQGKGYAITKLFRDIEADIFVMVDGDATYHAPSVKAMITALVSENLDLVVGIRKETGKGIIFPLGHRIGNQLFNSLLRHFYGSTFTDVFSGYRVLSERFVKTFPLTSTGFDIEAEMSIYALDLGINYQEMITPYRARKKGSFSKLQKYKDGWIILKKIALLFKENKPLQFFGTLSFLSVSIATILMIPVLSYYFSTGLVPRFPTLIVSITFVLIGVLSFVTGLILYSLAKFKLENRMLYFLKYPSLLEYKKRLKF